MKRRERYDGPVVFSGGVHYPVVGGQPDMTRPLRYHAHWFHDNGYYVLARPKDMLHNDRFGGFRLDLEDITALRQRQAVSSSTGAPSRPEVTPLPAAPPAPSRTPA